MKCSYPNDTILQALRYANSRNEYMSPDSATDTISADSDTPPTYPNTPLGQGPSFSTSTSTSYEKLVQRWVSSILLAYSDEWAKYKILKHELSSAGWATTQNQT